MCMFDSWASSDDVWIKMLNKELKYIHDKTFMQQHPSLQPKMRAILLDWLLEVCDLKYALYFSGHGCLTSIALCLNASL